MTEYLDVPGGRIAYDVKGSAEHPLVVCTPGMGDIRSTYRHLTGHLVNAGYRVAAMDLRGLGESSAEWESTSQGNIGSDIVALVRKLGGPAVVVAHSYTPNSAVKAAAEAPDDVHGIVLLAPWSKQPEPGALMAQFNRLVVRTPALWARFYTYTSAGPKPADFREHLTAVKNNLRQPGRTDSFYKMTIPAARDAEQYAAWMTRPALIVMGDRDPDFKDPRKEAETVASALAGPTEIALLKGIGHYVHSQDPDGTSKTVLAFLNKTLPR